LYGILVFYGVLWAEENNVGMDIVRLRIIFCWYYTAKNIYFMIWVFLSLILGNYNLVQGSSIGMLGCYPVSVLVWCWCWYRAPQLGCCLVPVSNDIVCLWVDDERLKWPAVIPWRILRIIRNYEKYEILKAFLIYSHFFLYIVLSVFIYCCVSLVPTVR
jgi:hypothetical protein